MESVLGISLIVIGLINKIYADKAEMSNDCPWPKPGICAASLIARCAFRTPSPYCVRPIIQFTHQLVCSNAHDLLTQSYTHSPPNLLLFSTKQPDRRPS
ncbi:hypothetical protein BJX76DRAFT_220241 [Aspergillus varians]